MPLYGAAEACSDVSVNKPMMAAAASRILCIVGLLSYAADSLVRKFD